MQILALDLERKRERKYKNSIMLLIIMCIYLININALCTYIIHTYIELEDEFFLQEKQ